jgi:outer membrane protein assembly factor BamB
VGVEMRRIFVVLSTRYSVLCRSYAVLLLAVAYGTSARAQVFDRSAPLPPADVELLDAASASHLENAKRFLAERQWSEGVEAIRRVQEVEPARLVKVDSNWAAAGFERYITAGEYCQWRLASLAAEAPEALAHYRRLVDSLAEAWLREGEKANDEALLRRVVEQAFASRSGDEALLKLGDLALARGDIGAARGAWHRISPALAVPPAAAGPLRVAAGSPLWLALRKFDFAGHGADLLPLLRAPHPRPLGIYPDSDVDPAALLARFALASILEGSRERATIELNLLRLLDPEAEGQLAGRRGRYADSLKELLEESATWPERKQSPDWPTFGGSTAREKAVNQEIDLPGRPLWSYPLPRLTADRELIGAGRLRPADDARSLLSYHPIVVENKVLLRLDGQGRSYVVSLDLKTGQRLWQVDYSRGIARQPTNEPLADDKPLETSDAHGDLGRQIGVARYTLSASGHKLFARMGSPITVPSSRRAALWLANDQGFLLGLDLATQGKPLEGFPIRPPSSQWTFEGPPLSGDGAIYVAMRRVEGARSQLYLAAFELQMTPIGQPDDRDENFRPTGRLLWRTQICSSATLGGGDIDQLTHLLVTQTGNRLYLNTGSGAVAALRADDGRLLWLVKYPRSAARTASADQFEPHPFRDLTPCLVWKDLLVVAPADCERIFALNQTTGELAWTLAPGAADDAVHLLGASDDTFIASGDSLYFIDAHTGRLLTQFPLGKLGGAEQSAPSPRGFGRGLIAGGHVWWPTRESIFVFEARPAATGFGWQPRLVREIPLLPRGVTGGNLVLAEELLLIATGEKLVAFER